MSTTLATPESGPAKSKLWKPPIVGLVTFVLMFLAVGLGHTMMIMIEHGLGRETTLAVSPLLGFTGIIMLWYGVKSKNETFQTWIGFFGALIVGIVENHGLLRAAAQAAVSSSFVIEQFGPPTVTPGLLVEAQRRVEALLREARPLT